MNQDICLVEQPICHKNLLKNVYFSKCENYCSEKCNFRGGGSVELKQNCNRLALQQGGIMALTNMNNLQGDPESVPGPFFTMDFNGVIISANLAFSNILGLTEKETSGMLINEFLIESEHEKFKAWLNAGMKTGKLDIVDFHFISRKAKIVLNFNASISLFDNIPLVCCSVNVVAKTNLGKDVLNNGGSLATELAFGFSFDAIFILNEDRKVLQFNKNAEDFFEYQANEMKGGNISLFIPDWYEFEKKDGLVAGSDSFVDYSENYKYFGRRKDGNLFPVFLKKKEIRNSGNVFLWVVVYKIQAERRQNNSAYEINERFTKAFQHASIGIALIAPDGTWMKVNNSVSNIVGYSEEELINFTIQDITHPDDWALEMEQINKLLCSEIQVYKTRKRFFHKDGQVIWVFVSASLVRAQNAAPLYFIYQIEDITEWRQTQEALQKSEERLRLMVSGTNLGIWEWTQSGQDYMSDKFCELVGYSVEELNFELKSIFGFIHPQYRASAKKKLEKYFHEEHPFKIEFPLKLRNGEYAWFLIAGKAQLDEQKEPRKVVGYIEDINEKKRAEIQFEGLFNSSPDSIIIVDGSLKIVMVNSQAEKLLGVAADGIIGESVFSFIPELIDVLEEFRNFSSEKEWEKITDTNFELYAIRKDEQSIPVEVALNPLGTGKTRRLILTVRDISKRLSDSAERKRIMTALNETTDGILMFEVDSLKHIYVNAGASRQLGYSEDELLTMTPLDFKVDFNEDEYRKLLKPLIASKKQSIQVEAKHKHRNGNIFDVEIIFKLATLDASQKIVVGVVRDITERKRAEEALQTSEERYRGIYENSIFGIYRTNKDGKIIMANPALVKLLGFNSLGEMQKRNLNKEGFDSTYSRNEFIQLIESKGKLTDHESVWVKKNGEEIYVRENVTLVIDRLTGEHFYDATVEDVTGKKEIEEERIARQAAEEANKAKSIFLANMSHEIRTPLNSIIGFSNLLYASITDSKQKSQVDSIRSSGKGLLTIINDILDLSKIEAGKLQLNTEPTNLHELLKDIELIMTPIAEGKGIPFHTVTEGDSHCVLLLDELRVKQVLLNLVNNAVKFTEKGHVTLYVNVIFKSEEKADISFIVQDTGLGIPQNELEAIFEPFIQKKGQDVKEYGGTGLGLTITREIVEMMHGNISVTSRPGKGSSFKIFLSDVVVNEGVLEGKPNYEEEFDPYSIIFEEARIMIVDDNKYNRELIKDFLFYSPIEIIEAENGKEAVTLSLATNPDLILMDIKMPVMDGWKASEIIKSNRKTESIPIIAISASTLNNREESEYRFFEEFLLKPVVFSRLAEALKKYLKHNQIYTKKVELIPKSYEVVFTKEQQQRIIGLISRIETEFLPLCNQALEKQVINQMELFGEKLSAFGKEEGVDIWTEFGNEIIDFAQKFEVDNLISKLNTFPELILQIKEKIAGRK